MVKVYTVLQENLVVWLLLKLERTKKYVTRTAFTNPALILQIESIPVLKEANLDNEGTYHVGRAPLIPEIHWLKSIMTL